MSEQGDTEEGSVDFIQTEPQYEPALEAVLGEKLHYIIVKNHLSGIEALKYFIMNPGILIKYMYRQKYLHILDLYGMYQQILDVIIIIMQMGLRPILSRPYRLH